MHNTIVEQINNLVQQVELASLNACQMIDQIESPLGRTELVQQSALINAKLEVLRRRAASL